MKQIEITIENEDQKAKILEVLNEAEMNGELDFAFSVKTYGLASEMKPQKNEVNSFLQELIAEDEKFIEGIDTDEKPQKSATDIWYDEWVRQGKTDTGTCCGGKCIRDRKTDRKLATSPPVQGNLSASRSVQPALDHLKAQGYDAYYDDGWMD